MVKEPGNAEPAKMHYADLWGLRGDWPNPKQGTKYYTLSETDSSTTEWYELDPHSPFYLFVKRDEAQSVEYEKGWKVTDIFPINSVGIVTARDDLTIKWSDEEVENTIQDFAELPSEEARAKYNLGEDVRDWKVTLAQKDLKDTGLNPDFIVPILYRPFDVRHTYYTGNSRGFHCMPRGEVMRHMLAGNNLGLCTNREVNGDFHHILCSRDLINDCTVSLQTRERTYLFPLYLYPAEGELQFEGGKRRPNLNPEFIKAVSEKLGLQFIEDGMGDLKKNFGPEDIFNYAYAVFHSPTYRTRYAEFLKIDFPRLPLTSDKRLFAALAEKGAELVALHLMESPALNTSITRYPVTGSNVVEKVAYNETNGRVYINEDQYFEGVPPEVWNFHIGGYQVCQKWLKDRQKAHRTLSYDDLTHYQKIVVALKETIRLMGEIDSLIPAWPLE